MEQEKLRAAHGGRGLLWAPALASRLPACSLICSKRRALQLTGRASTTSSEAHSPEILEAGKGLDSPLVDSKFPEGRVCV